jgi:hypothetical protein
MGIMKIHDLIAGKVFHYPYLWRREGQQGETEGRKDRPVCLALAFKASDGIHLAFLPITGTAPTGDQKAIEIPATELKRAGLDHNKRGWVIVSEFNHDILDRSFYFELSQQPLGHLGELFMTKVLKAFWPFLRSIEARVDRTDT